MNLFELAKTLTREHVKAVIIDKVVIEPEELDDLYEQLEVTKEQLWTEENEQEWFEESQAMDEKRGIL